MAGRIRRAPQPSEELLKAREERKALERLKAQAAPAQRPSRAEHNCAGQPYKVTGGHVVHGKARGEVVTLCPHKGATQALVQGGHLVPTNETSAAMGKADDKKEADHG